jgi:Fic family protein
MRESGKYIEISVGGEIVRAFVPHPLPPVDPPLGTDIVFQPLLEDAILSLGRLDAMASLLPQTWLFIYMYVRKEAVLSSQIEGTQSTLSDLLAAEIGSIPGALTGDVREVSNYVAALDHGLVRLRGGFPLCNRLIREMHSILLSSGRGQAATPGEFRRSQNWIGGTRPGNAMHVPPPPNALPECLQAFEAFLNLDNSNLPVLIQVALIHAQFESIHPFLDGNGRLGRLLIPLFLVSKGVLQEPLLYLSLYFRQNRGVYYDMLQTVRLSGNWEKWISFFLEGVKITAEQALVASKAVLKMFAKHQELIKSRGRSGASALMVHSELKHQPLCTIAKLSEKLGLSHVATGRAVNLLESIGILKETTGRQRGRIYAYDEYLKLLNDEMTSTNKIQNA